MKINSVRALMWAAIILCSALLGLGVRLNWMLYATAISAAGVGLILTGFERRHGDSRLVVLVGVLTALTVASRQLLHGVEFTPVFTLVIATGNVFGFSAGFATGALTMLISNFFLGQGPWTPFQMLGLGLTGAFAAFVPKKGGFSLPMLIAYSVVSAFLYGALLDTFFWMSFIPDHTDVTLLAILSAGVFAAISRALGNVFFMAIMGPVLLRILMRFKRRFVFRYVDERPT